MGYGVGSGSPLCPSFNFNLEIVKSSQAFLYVHSVFWSLKVLVLLLADQEFYRRLGSKTFRFFNFWFDHPNFKSVVGIYLDLKTSLKLSNWTIFLPKSTGSGGDYNSRFFDSDMKARQTSFETWVGG
ncbi:hypothetical protein JHK82_011434 [Glycine max]|nr:hypothetical protein JHK85_011751 [Glycine max]KAG5153465.1 hypothetical protein JHK82_011434 [Glycine max]